MCSFFGTLCFPQTLHGSPKSSFARAFEYLNGLAGGAGAAFTAALAADLGAGFGEAFGAAFGALDEDDDCCFFLASF